MVFFMNATLALTAQNTGNPAHSKLPPSNKVVQYFLDNRPQADECDDISGVERQRLKDAIFPYLKDNQKAKCQVDDAKYNTWLTDTLRQRRKKVIIYKPEFTTKTQGFVARARGQDNGLSTAGLQAKNQRHHIKASKNRHENNNPNRTHKWHGTATKRGWSSKYNNSAKGKATELSYRPRAKKLRKERRQRTLDEEMDNNRCADMTSEERDAYVTYHLHTPGMLEEYPGRTIYELVEPKTIVLYSGLCQWEDRLEFERLRFLIAKNDNYRPVLEWDSGDGQIHNVTKNEAIHVLGFKTKVVYKGASMCGMQAYMTERSFMKQFEHMELGTQRLNRVTGAGHPYRNVPGYYHVFLTDAPTDILQDYQDLVVVE